MVDEKAPFKPLRSTNPVPSQQQLMHQTAAQPPTEVKTVEAQDEVFCNRSGSALNVSTQDPTALIAHAAREAKSTSRVRRDGKTVPADVQMPIFSEVGGITKPILSDKSRIHDPSDFKDG